MSFGVIRPHQHFALDMMSDIEYSSSVKEVRTTAEFDAWLEALRDDRAAARIGKRIDRIEDGNYGDHKRFDGLIEYRIDVGPGYRLYAVEREKVLVILLAGGTKSGQNRDITRAIMLAKNI